jgi:hypothetical protein
MPNCAQKTKNQKPNQEQNPNNPIQEGSQETLSSMARSVEAAISAIAS